MHTAASASIAAVVNSQHTTTVSADCVCARHPARPLLKVNRACSSVASTVETTVTSALATAKSTGPDNTTSTHEETSPTPPPHSVKRANAAGVPDAEPVSEAGAASAAEGADSGRRRRRIRFPVMVSMTEGCPSPLTGR
ncbi:hypothetical protein ACIP98_06040 [Streptomyces sp. NPDC088354]|uniref:hypothetical protein n=1 Tax=unclassified Streptomyces TaxID=2593676 RepID=UPI0029A4AFCD|nr:hypothetical protein [Streptomyces sp. MI02-7b]MDX3073832.1 hypothetical protein [Streptomyces sp. MI02-7b]